MPIVHHFGQGQHLNAHINNFFNLNYCIELKMYIHNFLLFFSELMSLFYT